MTFDRESLPNGPARLVTDLRKDKFRLDYAGGAVLQVTVRLRRGENVVGLKEGGARLIAISKSDGWDRVTQTIRASAVALTPGDTLVIKGIISGPSPSETDPEPAKDGLERNGATIYCRARDIQLTFEPADAVSWTEDPGRYSPSTASAPRSEKLCFEANVDELMIVFRPQFSRFHQ